MRFNLTGGVVHLAVEALMAAQWRRLSTARVP